jgi:nitrogenase molybdenum-cofactor synthesis protein NifE
MSGLADMLNERYQIPYIRVSYFGIEDMAEALYKVAEHFADPEMLKKAQALVRQEVAAIMPELKRMRTELTGKRAAIYVGGSFKAVSLIRALRLLGIKTVVAGSQTGNAKDYAELQKLCDEDTILVDDANPLELVKFIKEKNVDLLIGGVKERPIAYKMGVAFCDHNHERKEPLAGFSGMLNFAKEIHASVMTPIWNLVPRRGGL